jgi:hypothetical protein
MLETIHRVDVSSAILAKVTDAKGFPLLFPEFIFFGVIAHVCVGLG